MGKARGGISPFPSHEWAEERHGVAVGTVRGCCFTQEGGKTSKKSKALRASASRIASFL